MTYLRTLCCISPYQEILESCQPHTSSLVEIPIGSMHVLDHNARGTLFSKWLSLSRISGIAFRHRELLCNARGVKE